MTARDPLHEHEARRALLDAALRLIELDAQAPPLRFVLRRP